MMDERYYVSVDYIGGPASCTGFDKEEDADAEIRKILGTAARYDCGPNNLYAPELRFTLRKADGRVIGDMIYKWPEPTEAD